MNDASEVTAVPAADAPDRFTEMLTRATEDKERVILTRAGRPVAALVPIEDLAWLEAIADRLDAEDYRAAREEFERSGGQTVPWEQMKRDLGL
ncbi:MAG TPA: type II toxin-antitoxin system Phd/YefM family antitoxin [Geminicoccaceae bacterium]|nr:type II toxin-antitoxin system Phd/YefM family antitoxin [Geminicoccaceae bacterium]